MLASPARFAPSAVLPWRGAPAARPDLGVPLPPARMPLLRGGRPLKRWRWIGCFSEELMLCAASARIGGLRVDWWAVWDRRQRTLAERTTRRGGAVETGPASLQIGDGSVRADVVLEPGAAEAVETVSAHGEQYAWTRKRAGVPARGSVSIGDRRIELDGAAVIDDSAGYHARHTAWRWSAGVGVAASGARVAWNLVEGLHDGPQASERTVWVDGTATQVAPQPFAADLSGVGGLAFSPEARRARRERLWLVASDYEQPFGTFSGELPGAGALRSGLGVMERHSARW